MIDTKYGLKYSMPHSVVHIVDNSAYTGPLPVVVADDPSMYATLVVTGAPMGVDNKVVTITRSDVANTAFGLGAITKADRKKYGQSIDYPLDLISQGAPVKFMRVTPDDAKYAFSCVLIQWRRVEDSDGKRVIHVRFKLAPDIVTNDAINFGNFKNPSRLNDALISYYKTYNDKEDSTDGLDSWKQRVFITNISAGRGSEYNHTASAIDKVSQSKRRPNICYRFSTIDTLTDNVIEEFTASLINTYPSTKYDTIESVNSVINKRLEGSSVLIPFVNEDAIKEIYNEYINTLSENIETLGHSDEDNFKRSIQGAINVNTFDVIFGKHMYAGGEEVALPYYQVDAIKTSVPKLNNSSIIEYLPEKIEDNKYTEFDPSNPQNLYDILMDTAFGINKKSDAIHVGDLYLVSNKDGSNPRVKIVSNINQYTGTVSTLIIPKLFPLKNDESKIVVDKTASKAIACIIDGVSATNNANIKAFIKAGMDAGEIINSDSIIIAMTNTPVVNSSSTQFTLYTLSNFVNNDDIDQVSYDVVGQYGIMNIYDAFDWDSHSSKKIGCNNSIGIDDSGNAWLKPGYMVILSTQEDEEEAPSSKLYINNLNVIEAQTADSHTDTDGRIKLDLSCRKCVVGEPNSEVSTSANVIGSEYDILVYKNGTTTASEDYKHKNTSNIYRYIVTGTSGSLFRPQLEQIDVPGNYYSDQYGISFVAENCDIKTAYGSSGFFDDYDNGKINDIVFKWKYSALLVRAFRGEIDPRINSPIRVPAKYLFDGATNTIIGQTMLPYLSYEPADIINASTIFTSDEKDQVLFKPDCIAAIGRGNRDDIDVKQAMYDLMITRCYQNIPEDKRPIGPGSGLSLHLDAGICDTETAKQINEAFSKRFDNPNASWDIGGYVSLADGLSYTYTKRLAQNLHAHSKKFTVNKPYVGERTAITPDEYSSYFPNIDATEWDLRELLYKSGGNAWIPDINGNITRRSQRTLMRDAETSDLVQESNMRTLSQLVYLLQNKIDSYLLEYNDDAVLKTLSDECNNMFSNWVGSLVQALDISFERDINIDGGDIVVCYVNVTFRGLILRVPIIVNVNRRES